MKWLAFVLILLLSAIFTWVFVAVAWSIGYTLNPTITFIAIAVFIYWMAM